MTLEPSHASTVSHESQSSDPTGFFQELHRTYLQAERVAGGPVDRFYEIEQHIIHLRFAGTPLVPRISPALEHLRCEASETPALTVCLWDSASTGTTPPAPPWSASDYLDRGTIRGYNTNRVRTAFHGGPGVLSMLDNALRTAVYWLRDASQHPTYMTGSPLLTILQWWAEDHGYQCVHAAAVGTTMGGLLLAGKGGSGKSTIALACLDSELLYLADDYCLVSTDSACRAFSLYSSGKVDAFSLRLLPHLQSAALNAEQDFAGKALLFIHECYPSRIAKSFTVRAVVLPKFTRGGETRLSATSGGRALAALAPSTLFQLSGAGQAAFRVLARLVRQVPCYDLEVGADLSGVPDLIVGLLSGR